MKVCHIEIGEINFGRASINYWQHLLLKDQVLKKVIDSLILIAIHNSPFTIQLFLSNQFTDLSNCLLLICLYPFFLKYKISFFI